MHIAPVVDEFGAATQMTADEDVFGQVARWRSEGRSVAIATVVATWGSSPRPPGSQLAVHEGGEFVGSVSGGCVEAAVVDEAKRVLRGGPPRLLPFSVGNELAWEVGLACGGRMEVLVERLADGPVTAALDEARAARIPCVLVTRLTDGARDLVLPDRIVGESGLGLEVTEEVREALAADTSGAVDTPAGRLFLHVFAPPPRLIVIGAVHVAEPLVRMAAQAGYGVTVIDPRRAFARREVFAGVSVVVDWPDVALAALAPDARTAVVTLTHDPKLDDTALRVALASEAFYVGSLGSRKTHAARLERLRRAGIGGETLARVHGPVGLAIGARTAAEIAVSILAEIISVRRLGPGLGGVAAADVDG